jgi:hypothetical protein
MYLQRKKEKLIIITKCFRIKITTQVMLSLEWNQSKVSGRP